MSHDEHTSLPPSNHDVQTTLRRSRLLIPSAEDHTYSYLLGLLRRRTARGAFDTANTPSMVDNSVQSVSRILERILQGPVEIRHLFLQALDPKSLLSLRQVNKQWHEEVHQLQAEKAVCKALEKLHSPILIPDYATFFRITNKHEVHSKLADVLTSRIITDIRFVPFLDDQVALAQWKERKRRRLTTVLTRAFIILGYYIDLYRDIIIKNEVLMEALGDEEFKSLQNIFDLDQQELLRKAMPNMTEGDFIDVSSALHIFKHICRARLVPFNLKTHAFPFASVRQILVHMGFEPFVLLLESYCNQQRQAEVLKECSDTIIARRQVKPSVSDKPSLSSIHHIRGYAETREVRHDHKRHSRVRDAFISHQDIWDRAARAVMMPKLGRFPVVLKPDEWIRRIIVEKGEMEGQILIGSWDKSDSG